MRSIFATPNPLHQEVFYTVHRAGHLIAGVEHSIRRKHYPGHELIVCLNGAGFLRIDGREHEVGKRDLAWVDCRMPHHYGAVVADPWEVYWVRFEGPRLTRLGELLGVAAEPIFRQIDFADAKATFEQTLDALESADADAPAQVHASIARLLAIAFRGRRLRAGEGQPVYPAELEPAVQRMKLFYFERCSVADLAERCGMSGSHFARRFRAAFGTGPIDWLRRERINQAKRRLVETDDAIKQIAEQVGYHDRFFFSKDFRKLAGVPPREYRRHEATREAEK
ncbi:helix-turn-helix transcriptional regulator [Humisphaera borealis]|uniref:AraC family transcriptional regulator n=1 Tax=Humisphaera borealis TaxID=2807512 RepID=A0A7M2WTC5_9BACT|nr:AraC family transcriptional regulator [Humisphaera borealis]QOV88683.1 AraC family transcriptional regulator [Humisphaera borealis]